MFRFTDRSPAPSRTPADGSSHRSAASAWILLLPLLLGGGCGPGADGDGGDGPDGGSARAVALDDLASAYAKALCASVFACCDPTDRAKQISPYLDGSPPAPQDEAGCVQMLSASFQAQTEIIRPSLDAGELVYDPSEAGQCLSSLAAQGCALVASDAKPVPEDPSCDRMLQANRTLGESCLDAESCIQEGERLVYCAKADGASSGVCTLRPAAGQACGNGWACEAGAGCATSANGSVCVRPPGSGEPCPEWSCATDLWCDGQSKTCKAITVVGVGTSCDGDGVECEDGLFCDRDPAGTTHHCVAPGPVGAPCDWDGLCESGLCAPDGLCGPAICGGL